MTKSSTSGTESSSASSPHTGSGDGSLAHAAESVIDKAKGAAGEVASSQFAKITADQKGRASGTLSSVATALRHTSDQLREQNQDMFARYLDRATTQVEGLSERVQSSDFRTLVKDAERYARQEPAIFLGGLFAVGVIAARFLKSSATLPSTGPSAITLALRYSSAAASDGQGLS